MRWSRKKKRENIIFKLHELAQQGDVGTLNTVLSQAEASEKDDLLHEVDNALKIPIHYAIKHQHCDVIKLLLQHGTDPNWKTDRVKFNTPLSHFAYLELEFESYALAKTVQYLLDYGADPTIEFLWEEAILMESFKMIYFLLNHPKVITSEHGFATLRDRLIAFVNTNGETPLHRLLSNFTCPPEPYIPYERLYNRKRCLYAILLSDVDVKGLLSTLGFDDASYKAIHGFVTEAEEFIENAKKEFGLFGQAVVHRYILSAEQEQAVFKQESDAFIRVMQARNNAITSGVVNSTTKEFPTELSMLVCKNLAPQSIHFFQPNRSNDKISSVDEKQSISRLTL